MRAVRPALLALVAAAALVWCVQGHSNMASVARKVFHLQGGKKLSLSDLVEVQKTVDAILCRVGTKELPAHAEELLARVEGGVPMSKLSDEALDYLTTAVGVADSGSADESGESSLLQVDARKHELPKWMTDKGAVEGSQSGGRDEVFGTTVSMREVLIGEGGASSFMKWVEQPKEDEPYVVKVVKTLGETDGDAARVRRACLVPAFLRQQEGALRLPGTVVDCIGYGQDGHYTYMVMKKAKGKSWKNSLADLSLRQNTAIMATLLVILDDIHRAGFVHGDVKPGAGSRGCPPRCV